MKKKSKAQNDKAFEKAKAAVQEGMPAGEAFKKFKITSHAYYSRLGGKGKRRTGKRPYKRKQPEEIPFQEITIPGNKKTLLILTEDAATVESIINSFIKG